jgi:tRNA modification GTPase
LIEALAQVEAGIDFSDEADVPEDLIGPALKTVERLCQEFADVLASAGRGERLRDGLVVAIAGPPNAGKSTLFNRIARRDAAIVSPVAGTTRDVIEVHLDLGGYPVTLLDTAGIGDGDDPVEQEGVRRARQRASEADLVLWVEDVRDRGRQRPDSSLVVPGAATWRVFSKIDIANSGYSLLNEDEFIPVNIYFPLSAATGEGMNQLVEALARHASEFFGVEPALVSRQRHRLALETALSALKRALDEGAKGREDIIAEELRLAAGTLGKLTGRVDVEDVLDVIFRDFCIGK